MWLERMRRQCGQQLTLVSTLVLSWLLEVAASEADRLPGWGGEKHQATDDSCHIHPNTELVRTLTRLDSKP